MAVCLVFTHISGQTTKNYRQNYPNIFPYRISSPNGCLYSYVHNKDSTYLPTYNLTKLHQLHYVIFLSIILTILVDCGYSNWGNWEECDQQCGGGSQSRRRNIVTEAGYGGIQCTDDDTVEYQSCNQKLCSGDYKA